MDRTGLLIIRAWIEDGAPEPLHAQIRLRADVSSGSERTLTLADPDEICEVVQEWLDGVMGDADPAG